MPQGTLHYWLEGKTQSSHTYSPVIRVASTGSKSVTWAEFVEAGLLRAYRQREVPMAELRAFIQRLRDDLGMPYPLAQERPFTSGKSLVERAQEKSGLPSAFSLVYRVKGQLLLTTAAEAFVPHRLRGRNCRVVASRQGRGLPGPGEPECPVRAADGQRRLD